MSDPEVKALSLFFFFTILDEARAVQAASLALETFHRNRLSRPDVATPVLIVQASFKIWKKLRPKIQRGRPQFGMDSGWLFPDGADLGAWKEYQKKATDEELLSVVWSQILKISDEDIANGLGLSLGSVRFRVGRGLRKLGSFQKLNSVKPSMPRIGR